MRGLRVVGLAADTGGLLCVDPDTGEEFAVAVDDRVRSLFRGDHRRRAPASSAPVSPSTLRPRDIQLRVRAGESVESVAEAAGTTVARIERFAYPVLLERSTMAQRGRAAAPVVGGTTGKTSVEKLVLSTLAARGQRESVSWDAHRTEDGWVLTVRWLAGRSENRATFAMHPGPDSGTVTPLDETAGQLLDPVPQPLRTVQPAAAPTAGPTGSTTSGPTGPVASRPDVESDDPGPSANHPALRARRDAPATSASGSSPVGSNASRTDASSSAPAAAARTGTDAGASGTRRPGRPTMPSWDDVLLGSSRD